MLVFWKGPLLGLLFPNAELVSNTGIGEPPLPWLDVTLKPVAVPAAPGDAALSQHIAVTLDHWDPSLLEPCMSLGGRIQKTGITSPKKNSQGFLYPMASDQLPHGTSCHAPSRGDGHRAADTLWFPPASRGHVFALALAGPPPRFFQGDVLPQQLGMEMLLLWGEYHQKHLSVPGHCSAGGAQSGASPAGKERREVKDKLKLERKLNMPFHRILLALICQFFFHPLPLPMASGAV